VPPVAVTLHLASTMNFAWFTGEVHQAEVHQVAGNKLQFSDRELHISHRGDMGIGVASYGALGHMPPSTSS